jgi:hypothetical protein
MTEATHYYDVTLTTTAEGPDVAEALFHAFNTHRPLLAGTPPAIGAEGDRITVSFCGVSDDPVHGLTSIEASAPGAEIVAALAGFSSQHLLTVALLRALLTFSAMREAAGLPPRDKIRIDVVPSPPPSQDTLSQRLSEGVASPPEGFARSTTPPG